MKWVCLENDPMEKFLISFLRSVPGIIPKKKCVMGMSRQILFLSSLIYSLNSAEFKEESVARYTKSYTSEPKSYNLYATELEPKLKLSYMYGAGTRTKPSPLFWHSFHP